MQKRYFYCYNIYAIELVNFSYPWMQRSSRISYSYNAVSWLLLSFSERRLCCLDSNPGAYLAVCAHPYPKALEISSHLISISVKASHSRYFLPAVFYKMFLNLLTLHLSTWSFKIPWMSWYVFKHYSFLGMNIITPFILQSVCDILYSCWYTLNCFKILQL